jgi:hypothetical protein
MYWDDGIKSLIESAMSCKDNNYKQMIKDQTQTEVPTITVAGWNYYG